MYYRLIATIASFLFVMLLSFPSLGMESNNNVFEEQEKELIENAGEILIRESNEVILPEACGFVVVLFPTNKEERISVTSPVALYQHYLFLRYCSLQI